MKIKGDRVGCKGKGNIFCAIVLRRVIAQDQFQYQFKQFKGVTMSGKILQQVCDNADTKVYCHGIIEFGLYMTQSS